MLFAAIQMLTPKISPFAMTFFKNWKIPCSNKLTSAKQLYC